MRNVATIRSSEKKFVTLCPLKISVFRGYRFVMNSAGCFFSNTKSSLHFLLRFRAYFSMHQFFNNQAIWIERMTQSWRQQSGRVHNLRGDVGSTQRRGCQATRTVRGVDIGMGQIGTRRVNAVIFVQRVFGIHLTHGIGIAQRANGRQMVMTIATQRRMTAR